MDTISSYFDKIFCINLAKRKDRWKHAEDQFKRYGFTAERFEGYDDVIYQSVRNGNCGCTASHRALLEIIAYHRWNRVLVLEDDFEVRADFEKNFASMFALMVPEVPQDWDMLYLGGGYAEPPVARVSQHVIKIGRMMTTSSYGITWQMARKMAPYVSGVGPIDCLYSGFLAENRCYIFQPRLMVQYSSFSDLQESDSTNAPSMEDTRHEQMV